MFIQKWENAKTENMGNWPISTTAVDNGLTMNSSSR